MFDFKIFYRGAFILSLFGLLAFVFDLGFSHSVQSQKILEDIYFVLLGIGAFAIILRYIERGFKAPKKVLLFDVFYILFTTLIFYDFLIADNSLITHPLLQHSGWIKFAVFLFFVREFFEIRFNFKRTVLNPAQLFVLSFLFIIVLGAFLLMMPNATNGNLSFIDALFTSTSAVCVTGLIVVDTATFFTEFGQFIILILIQIGGLGILTFASYFSYFFRGKSSYENQLTLSDMTNSKNLSEVFSTLKYIILITLTIEFSVALFIYFSVEDIAFPSFQKHAFFALFHSVSAFCNAGFSTLTNNLYEDGFRYNYFMQLAIITAFVLGGLGFPIVVNIMKFVSYHIRKLITFGKSKVVYKPWILNLNSRITLITTIALTVIGFIGFFALEYNNTLADHSGFGKIVTALFGATTPRTAGFNTIDMSKMLFPTTMLVFLLMWVGASPASTGGGIKTSTFAIAILNFISLAKGKSRIEVFRREISDISVSRAFATIALSLMVIGFGILIITIKDGRFGLMHIAFECFSAYSTVGLSLGITGGLSTLSKAVLIVIMFVGRVSMLSILIALFKKGKYKNYRYPKEEITIN